MAQIRKFSTNSVPQLYTVLKLTGFCYRFVADNEKLNRGLLENYVNHTCIFPIVKCSFNFSEDRCIWIYSKRYALLEIPVFKSGLHGKRAFPNYSKQTFFLLFMKFALLLFHP